MTTYDDWKLASPREDPYDVEPDDGDSHDEVVDMGCLPEDCFDCEVEQCPFRLQEG